VDKFRYISWHHGNCERTDDVRVLLSGVKNGAGYDDTNGIHGSDAVSCLCFGLSRHKASVKRKSATDNRFVLGPAWHRARPRRTPLGGGAAMALAAAIKLYPVIFALLWLAAGRKQSVVDSRFLVVPLGLSRLRWVDGLSTPHFFQNSTQSRPVPLLHFQMSQWIRC
jgi:hypothetical protein